MTPGVNYRVIIKECRFNIRLGICHNKRAAIFATTSTPVTRRWLVRDHQVVVSSRPTLRHMPDLELRRAAPAGRSRRSSEKREGRRLGDAEIQLTLAIRIRWRRDICRAVTKPFFFWMSSMWVRLCIFFLYEKKDFGVFYETKVGVM